MRQSPDPQTYYPLVYEVVSQVPHGVVSTYGQIASVIPPPDDIDPERYRRLAPKWVGEALNAISFSDVEGRSKQPGIPWWRIINSKGGISMPSGSRAADEQKRRLQSEGLTFDGAGRVELGRYGWEGPPQSWLDANALLKPKSLREPGKPSQPSLF